MAAARFLPPADYGLFMAVFGLWNVAALPSSAIQISAARLLAHGARRGTGLTDQLRSWNLRWLGATSPLLAVAAAASAPLLGLKATVAVAAVVISWWSAALVAWRRGRFLAEHRYASFGASAGLESCLRLGVALLLLAVIGLRPDWIVITAMAVSTTLAALALPPRRLGLDGNPLPQWTLAATFGTATAVTLSTGLLTNLDLLWGRYALPATDAGTFAAGTIASRPLLLMGAVAGTTLLPRAAGRLDHPRAIAKGIAALSLALLIPSLVGHVVAPPVAIWLYGPEYGGAGEVARYAIWGGLALAPAIAASHALLGLGLHRAAARLVPVALALVILEFTVARTPALYWLLAAILATGYSVFACARLLAEGDKRSTG